MNICKTYILCAVLGLLTVSQAGAQAAPNYEGMWVAPGEPGWGMSFTHQGDIIFATWFTYATYGTPFWLSMTAQQGSDDTFTGPVDLTWGSPFNYVPFDPSIVTHTPWGTSRLTFSDADNATFSFSDFYGNALVKTLTRFVFAAPQPVCTFNSALPATQATNYQGMWTAPGEPGWGISFAHQGDIIFATWFIYVDHGVGSDPVWVSATLTRTFKGTYEGALDLTQGPPLEMAPASDPSYVIHAFDPSRVAHRTVGSASVTFSDGNNGTLTYTFDPVTQTKALTRFVFRERGTVCQ